eukprot:8593707-Pyramimonas_sp.AAC.1
MTQSRHGKENMPGAGPNRDREKRIHPERDPNVSKRKEAVHLLLFGHCGLHSGVPSFAILCTSIAEFGIQYLSDHFRC